jgi:putative ABC transport system ATP-binding protein
MKKDNNILIKIESLSKVYGSKESKVKAVDDVSFDIHEGEFIALLGASGSGKSTLLHVIGAMDKSTSGTIYYKNKKINKMKEKELNKLRLQNIGFIFQTFNLMQSLTVLENVMLPMLLNKTPRKEAINRAKELINMVDLSERINHIPSKLSGGQKQRVAIARALANNPSIILADEPTGNLDSKNSDKIIKLLHELNDKGYTILMVTHNLELANNVDRVITMKDGKIK